MHPPDQTPDNLLSGLRTRRDILEVLWRQGLSGRALLVEHTQLIDSHLQQKFADCQEASSGMSLVAIGGYGRSELFPFSDIDLLLLHRSSVEDKLDSVAEAIFYPLWDAGLEVGHSVRTITACLADAKDDFFFRVALLDARFVAGDESLFDDLMSSYQDGFVEGQRQAFLKNMYFHREERHRRFGKHSYMLEPQIKEGRGGLRDLQALLWTAKVVFGLKGLPALKEAGLLSNEEYQNLDAAVEYLIKIRNRLHYTSTRKNDQLYFEHQEEIAKALKYRSTKGIMDVEHFMREVYGHLQTIAVTADLFFEHVDEVLTKTKPTTPLDIKELEAGIIIRKDRIHLTGPNKIAENPKLLVQVFLHSARTGLPVHHQSRKQISAHLNLIDDTFRQDHCLSKSFLELLQQDNAIIALEAMLECGVLAALIPEFAHLKSLAQHDVYHIFTVDHHSIQTVAILHQLKEEHHNIFSIIQTPHILFLAGLLHDIGKGYGADHCSRGRELVETISKRLNLPQAELELLEFSIQNHLFLTDTALRRDLEDPSLIKQCAQQVGSTEHLALLYLLSIADANATGPTVWNDWKGALLLDLYLKTALLLEKVGEEPHSLSDGLEWIKEKISAALKDESYNLDTLPDDYLLSFSPEDIADHIKQSRNLPEEGIIVRASDKKGYWSLLMVTKDRPGLLTKIAGVIALSDLELLTAQIFTWPDGTAVDIIEVRSTHEETHADQDWNNFTTTLNRAISYRLGLEYRLGRKNLTYRHKSAGGIQKQRPAKVSFNNKTSDTFTVIEVYTDNRIGIMHSITKVLTDFRINIYRAKISTQSDQVVDVFYVQDHNHKKITSRDIIEEIRQSILFAASP